MTSFLDKYDTLIFDMDGVITSEQNYWNSAALTAYEYLNSSRGFGTGSIDASDCERRIGEIRSDIFISDKLIATLKDKGVNSNWDLAYVTVLIYIITDGNGVLDYAKSLSGNILAEYDNLAELAAEKCGAPKRDFVRNERIWKEMQMCFQEWFLGDKLFFAEYGKKPKKDGKAGLINSEEPIVEKSRLISCLDSLSKTKRLCIGTGRPKNELLPPLERWGILNHFDQSGICTYDEVKRAEEKSGMTLTKPAPYTFVKAFFGTDCPDDIIIKGSYKKSEIKRVLVIGDAGADILAAKAMGADFCAVLTGVAGDKARDYFEEMNAEYILNSVCDMLD